MTEPRYNFDDAYAFYNDPKYEQPLRGAVPGTAVPIDARRSAWVSDDGTRRETLTPLEAGVLAACDLFMRAPAQADYVAERFGMPADAARALLDSLAARGLLRTPLEFLGADVARDATPLPPPLVAIRTCNRPAGLTRLLDSLLADERRLGVERRYLVCDDARTPEARAVNRAAAQRFARESRSRCWYVGADERDALFDAHVGDVPPAARAALDTLLRFDRLDTATGARSWNWAVLLSAGGTLSLLDDDFVFPIREPLGASPRLELWDSLVVETRFFDDAAGWQERPIVDRDPFAIAARWVGQPARALVPTDDGRFAELDNAPVGEIAGITPRTRVLGAAAGVYGALGHDTTAFQHLAGKRTLLDLWRAPYDERRLEGEHVWNGVLAPRLLYSLAATPLLLDNRELLPFAGSHGRVDDTFFLRLLRAIEPAAAFIWLPLLMGHFPDERRNRRENSLKPLLSYTNTHAAALLATLGDELVGATREARLGAMAALCGERAAASDATLADIALAMESDRLVDFVQRLGDALAAPLAQRAPPGWRAHADAMMRANRDALRNLRIEPREVARLRYGLAQVAHAATAWCALWRRCRDERPLDALPALPA
jgi:hypothetical protein